MAGHVWVVGSANYDLVFRTQRFPRPGETILGGSFASFPGGKGANQAVAIGRLGGDVRFVGCVGDDAFGQLLRTSLEEAGVNAEHLSTHPTAPSGCASVMLDSHGENQIIVAPGSNMEVSPAMVRESLQGAGDDPVLVQLEIPMESVLAAAEGRCLFLNPAPAQTLSDALLGAASTITPNQEETNMLVGIAPNDPESCSKAAQHFLDKGVRNVVITLGSAGCYWRNASDERLIEAPSVKAVDTVGAGDAFNGALTWFISQGRDWPNALALATHVAALSVTKEGAQPSMPTLAELKAFAPNLL